MKKSKRLLGVLLAIAMLAGVFPGAANASNGSSDGIKWWKSGESTATPGDAAKRREDAVLSEMYDDDDIVRVSIVLKEPSALEKFYEAKTAAKTIAANSAAVAYRGNLEDRQEKVAEAISRQVLNGTALDVVWNLTLVTNAISANVRFGDIEAIRRVSGVLDVYVEPEFEAMKGQEDGAADPNMATSSEQIGSSPAYLAGFYGAGMRIAIIDTGTNPAHSSFDGAALEHALEESFGADYASKLDLLDKEELGKKFAQLHINAAPDENVTAETVYGSTKMPFNYNYVDGNTDVSHENDSQGAHGSHVAGIAAANRYVNVNGVLTAASDSVLVQGVAPDAQLLTMKIFGRNGSAYISDQLAAIEDALVLGADVINMSIGTYYAGMTRGETEYQEVLDRLKSTDTVLTVSAGNYGSFIDLGSPFDKLFIEDVNMNTVGNPGAYTNSMTVASANNRGLTGSFFTVNGGDERVFYLEGSGEETADLTAGDEYGYVYIDSVGVVQTYDAAYGELGRLLEDQLKKLDEVCSLKGKVVVMNRGMSPFFAKANAASDLGAAAVVIVNNVEGTVGADLNGYTGAVPVFTVTMKDGGLFRDGDSGTLKTMYDKDGNYNRNAELSYYTGTITMSESPEAYFPEGTGDVMSDYSAWGVPGDLSLKPEITAPGGNIYSVNGNTKNGYTTMSGTSMAAPQLAGMAALVIQRIEKEGLKNKTQLSARELAQSLLMSTAVPMKESEGQYYPVLRQGAGLANVGFAVSSPSYILVEGQDDGKVKAELGDDPDRKGVYDIKFTIYNLTADALSYTVGADVFTQGIVTEDGDDYMSTETAPLTADVTVNGAYGSAKISVPGGGSADVTVTVSLTEKQKAALDDAYPNGAYIEAFVNVKPNGEGGVAHSIPVIGFYGGWTESSMFDRGNFVENLAFDMPGDEPYAGIYSNNIMVRYDGDRSDYFPGYPYGTEIDFLEDRNAFDPELAKVSSYAFTPLRNFLDSRIVIKDAETGEIYLEEYRGPGYATFYNEDYETWGYADQDAAINWRGTDADGEPLPDGTKVTVELTLAPEYYRSGSGDEVDWDALGEGATISSVITVDRKAPELIEIDDTTMEDGYITVTVNDNEYVGMVALYNPAARNEEDAYAYVTPNQTEPGKQMKVEVRLDNENTAVGETFILEVGDYAGHISEYTLKMDLTARVKARYNFSAADESTWYGYDSEGNGGIIGASAISSSAADYTDGYVFFADRGNSFYAMPFGDTSSAELIATMDVATVLVDVPEGDYDYDAYPMDMAYNEQDGLLYFLEYVYFNYYDMEDWETELYYRAAALVTLDPEDGKFTYKGLIYENESGSGQFEDVFIYNGANIKTIATDGNGKFYGFDDSCGLYEWDAEDPSEMNYLAYLSGGNLFDWGPLSASLDWDDENGCLVYACTTMDFDEDDEPIYFEGIYEIDLDGEEPTIEQIVDVKVNSEGDSINSLYVVPGTAATYDFNGDGVTNKTDAQTLLDYVTGKRTSIVKTAYSDINGDGKVNTYDVEAFLHMDLGSQRFAPTDNITRVIIDMTEAEITTGGRMYLDAYADPWFAADRGVTWSSSDEKIATVDPDGLVHAGMVGTVTITASSVIDPSVKAVCTVKVKPAEYAVSGALMDDDSMAKWFSMQTVDGQVLLGDALENDIDIISGTVDPTSAGKGSIYFQDSDGYMYKYDSEHNFIEKSATNAAYRMSDMTVFEEVTRRTGETKIVGVSGYMILYGVGGPLTDDFAGGWISMGVALSSYGASALVGIGYAGYFYEGSTLYEVLYAIDDIGEFWLLYFNFSDPENPQFESAFEFDTTLPSDMILPDEDTGVYLDSIVVSDEDTVLFSRHNGEKAELYLLEKAGFMDDDTFVVTSFNAAKIAEMEDGQWPAILLEAVYTGEREDSGWDDWDDEYGYDGIGRGDLRLMAENARPVGEAMSSNVSSASANGAKAASPFVDKVVKEFKSAADNGNTAKTVIKTDHTTNNGMILITYDTNEVKLAAATGMPDISSINDHSEGKIVFGWACSEDPFANGTDMIELVFERKSGSVDASDIKIEFVEDSGIKGDMPEDLSTEVTFKNQNPATPPDTGDTGDTGNTGSGNANPPQTGDGTVISVWMTASALGMLGIAAVLSFGSVCSADNKKKRHGAK